MRPEHETREEREATAQAVGREIGRAKDEGPASYRTGIEALVAGLPPEIAGQILGEHLRENPASANDVAVSLSVERAMDVVVSHLHQNPDTAGVILSQLPSDVRVRIIAGMTGLTPEQVQKEFGIEAVPTIDRSAVGMHEPHVPQRPRG